MEAEFLRCRDVIDQAYTTVLGGDDSEGWWMQERARREMDVKAWEEREMIRRAQQLKDWEMEDRRRLEAEEHERRQRLVELWDSEEAEFRRTAQLRFEAEEMRQRSILEAQQVTAGREAAEAAPHGTRALTTPFAFRSSCGTFFRCSGPLPHARLASRA